MTSLLPYRPPPAPASAPATPPRSGRGWDVTVRRRRINWRLARVALALTIAGIALAVVGYQTGLVGWWLPVATTTANSLLWTWWARLPTLTVTAHHRRQLALEQKDL